MWLKWGRQGVQNFGVEASWKISTWKMRIWEGINAKDLGVAGCEDQRWMELAQDYVLWCIWYSIKPPNCSTTMLHHTDQIESEDTMFYM
jgi:hypothetical protein